MGQEWWVLKEQEMAKYQRNPILYFEKNIKAGWDKMRPGAKHESENPGLEPQFDYFADTFEIEETLKVDQAKLEDRRKKFEKKTKRGEVGEYIFMEGIYELQWLKPDIEVMPTHEYDDVMKQTDFVLRFESENGDYVYLGVDVTTTKDADKIIEKRDKLAEYLEGGSLGSLKYFEDQDADIKGEFEMPKIVIGLSPDNVIQMQQIMVNERIRRKLKPADIARLLPQELAEFENDKRSAEKIQQEIEADVLKQLQIMITIINELIKTAKSAELKEKYTKFKRAYEKVLIELKEEG